MTQPLAFIVEDDPQLGKIYTLALQNDFLVDLYTEGVSALAQLGQVSPELIILDLHLPGANGQEILNFIQDSPHLAASHVILATADNHQADLLEDQVEIVLLKPISPLQLRELAVRLCKLQN